MGRPAAAAAVPAALHDATPANAASGVRLEDGGEGIGRESRRASGARRLHEAFDHAAILTNDSDLTKPVRIVALDLRLSVTLLTPGPKPSSRLLRYMQARCGTSRLTLAPASFQTPSLSPTAAECLSRQDGRPGPSNDPHRHSPAAAFAAIKAHMVVDGSPPVVCIARPTAVADRNRTPSHSLRAPSKAQATWRRPHARQ
jgi:hypothetical protein